MKVKIVVVDFELSPKAKRWALGLGIPLLVLAAAGIAAAAATTPTPTPHVWSQNDPLTAADLNGAFQAVSPPGTIIAYGGQIDGNPGEMIDGNPPTHPPPAGWLLCDGIQLNGLDASYSALYAAIGVSFGGNTSSKAFNLPDLRGYFLRGLDPGAVVDPDVAGRTPLQIGGNTGKNVGSLEADLFVSHTHGVNDPGHTHTYYSEGDGCSGEQGLPRQGPGSCVYGHTTAASGTGISIQSSGGGETRPKNVAVNYIIRY